MPPLLLFLLVLWLLLSGMAQPLLLVLGAFSAVFVWWLHRRLAAIDNVTHFPRWNGWAWLSYVLWLSGRVVVANLDVALRILSPRLPISPTVRRLPLSQRSEVGRVVYANSITLTPGTVTIDLSVGDVTVHALTSDGMAEVASGEMGRRVQQALEGNGT